MGIPLPLFKSITTEKRTLIMIDLMTDKGERLSRLSEDNKVLLVFLRHFGCTFCRETLAQIKSRREKIESKGVRIVFVHMMSETYAEEIFKIYDMPDIDHISDPAQRLYKHFGLNRGSWNQVFGLKVWPRFFHAGIFKGHLLGPLKGDGFQMPGVFLYHKNKIIKSYRHQYASDQPNYEEIACSSAEKVNA